MHPRLKFLVGIRLACRWEQKFKTSKNPALKSVTGRPSTPFRPRISLLPRRSVRTGTDPVPLTDLAYPVVRPGLTAMEALRARIWGWPLLLPKVRSPKKVCFLQFPMFRLNCLRICHKIVGKRDPVVILKKMSPRSLDFTPACSWGSSGVGATGLSRRRIPSLHSCSGLDSTIVRQDGLLTPEHLHRTEKSSSGQQRRWSTVAPKSGGQRTAGHGGCNRRGTLAFSRSAHSVTAMGTGHVVTSAKNTQIPVWIRLRHLPMEYWTDEGLSTVASGVGTPLYTDGITKDCSRLDFARVCVMLDFNSALPKHLVVISPVLRNGKEDPKRIDVEYEWLPQRCKSCCSLGHVSATCPANVKKNVAPPLTIFVQKQPPKLDPKTA
ncbi:UNVERIFIED_CONTAM: hypothetical protein Scaly_3105700 [Sesamum calycinum]|uniref:DUF4283 domain-containing protein n=1 Tax=Sesamum calycinum TaxID=2727403 RepID=A0AAW2JL09_9LAMI